MVLEAILKEKIGHFTEPADTRHGTLQLASIQKNGTVSLSVHLCTKYLHYTELFKYSV